MIPNAELVLLVVLMCGLGAVSLRRRPGTTSEKPTLGAPTKA
jgi:hypothetical protein